MQAKPVRKIVGGVAFEDRFPHLHDDTPEALAWQWERDRIAKQTAEASPNYAPIRDRLLELNISREYSTLRKRGSLWFSYVREGDDTVARASETPYGPGRAVVSKRVIAETIGGGDVTMAWLEPSPKGRFVALCWTVDGNMLGKWSVYETATGRHLTDTNGIMYTGARAGWLPDESGFWLNDRTAEGLHRLHFVELTAGTGARPAFVLSEKLIGTRHSGVTLQASPDARRGVLVTEPHEHVALVHLNLETLEPTPFLPDHYEGECDGGWIDGETYIARVNGGAPRGRVVAIPASTSRDMSTWRELVPEGDGFICWAGVVANRIYVGDLVDVSLRVRVFDLSGKLTTTLPLENPGASPSMLVERAIRPTDAFAFAHATFTRSSVTFVHDPKTGELRQVSEAKHRLDKAVAERRFARSSDGARVPYFVVCRKDVDLSRPQPTLVNAYGGFNLPMLPSFPATYVPFIEAGGVFVQASLRGGAEYGKAWHDAGRLFNKRNTFDDLEAVARALIADGLSTPEKMIFQGGSNGGLLAGVAIVFQSDLWRAVVPTVPIFDMMEMLPLTPDTAGARAVMYEDYGDTTVPETARSVITWSPYHNVKDGVVYPAIYQVFGEKDVGCMPFHGRKFTARLEEANSGTRPIHLRVWRNAGHGVTDPERASAWNAEWLAFAMDQIGMTAKGAST